MPTSEQALDKKINISSYFSPYLLANSGKVSAMPLESLRLRRFLIRTGRRQPQGLP
jgi:hypothetical protein